MAKRTSGELLADSVASMAPLVPRREKTVYQNPTALQKRVTEADDRVEQRLAMVMVIKMTTMHPCESLSVLVEMMNELAQTIRRQVNSGKLPSFILFNDLDKRFIQGCTEVLDSC